MKKINYIFFILFSSQVYGQLPAQQDNKVGFRSEWFGGLTLHSQGWGGTLSRAKFKTYKRYHVYTLDYVSMKHPKEFKVVNQVLEDAKGYKFGKLSSFSKIRIGYGQRVMLYEKLRENGVQIYFTGAIGGNLGVLKPIYLEILNYDINGNVQNLSDEKYDPTIHNQLNIYGKASALKGINESNLIFGAHAKAGFTFDFSKDREKVKALETGIMVDFYPERVPIMAFIQNKQLFINFYINILFGKKHYD